MASSRTVRTLLLASAIVAVGLVALGWRESAPKPDRQAAARYQTVRTARPADAADEAMRLYAAGQFAGACARFRAAVDEDPANALSRANAARCFEGWAWQALREGRPDEAMLLFSQGLRDAPDTPGLLRGLGVAAVHAGRPDDALAPLARAARVERDPEVEVLLARLYDRRDDAVRALAHVDAVLARTPDHADARRFRDKLVRERGAEIGFRRDETASFVVRSPAGLPDERRAAVVRLLDAASARVDEALAYHPSERLVVVLYDDADFRRVVGDHGWAGGAFDGKIRLPVGATAPALRDIEQLILHEYGHAAVHQLSRGRAPRWLHEGLAQSLEGAEVDRMLRVAGRPTLAGVEALVTDPDPLKAKSGYDLALWIVGDLLDRGGYPPIRALLVRLGAGEPLGDAMARVYGVRLTDLESQWRRLLGG